MAYMMFHANVRHFRGKLRSFAARASISNARGNAFGPLVTPSRSANGKHVVQVGCRRPAGGQGQVCVSRRRCSGHPILLSALRVAPASSAPRGVRAAPGLRQDAAGWRLRFIFIPRAPVSPRRPHAARAAALRALQFCSACAVASTAVPRLRCLREARGGVFVITSAAVDVRMNPRRLAGPRRPRAQLIATKSASWREYFG
jgi:hypothetical protein